MYQMTVKYLAYISYRDACLLVMFWDLFIEGLEELQFVFP